MTSFSERNGLVSAAPITFRYEAPENLRFATIEPLRVAMGLYDNIRSLVCEILIETPNPGNWSEVPNIRDEVNYLLQNADWFLVYDIIETAGARLLQKFQYDKFEAYQATINRIFERAGAGWQVQPDGKVEIRGDDGFEATYESAINVLVGDPYSVPRRELYEARLDLSKRPSPDLTGAVHHGVGSVESLARIQTGRERSLGELVQSLQLTPPLNEVVSKLWGYSSNFGRHVSPIRVPTESEATFVVHTSAAICEYLISNAQD